MLLDEIFKRLGFRNAADFINRYRNQTNPSFLTMMNGGVPPVNPAQFQLEQELQNQAAAQAQAPIQQGYQHNYNLPRQESLTPMVPPVGSDPTKPPLARYNEGDFMNGSQQQINNLSSMQNSAYMPQGILDTINTALAGAPPIMGSGQMGLPTSEATKGMTAEEIRKKYFDMRNPLVQQEFKKNPAYKEGLMNLYRTNPFF